MFDLSQTVEKLALEPSLPKVALCEFRGGNQLPIWDISEKDFQMRKQDSLVPLLLELWEGNDATDLVLKLGTKQICVNRLRFMCQSKFIKDNLKGGQRELVLPEDRVPAEGLVRVCDWINKPVAKLERCHIMQVLAAAIYLEIEPLVKQVWFCLDLVEDFREDQAFAVSFEALNLGDKLPLLGLDTTMLLRIQCFFLTLVASVEFVELPLQHVRCLLSSVNVAVNSEKEIFFSAVRWLNHDWAARAKHTLDIMETVRLLLLPRTFIMELQAPTDEPSLNCIIEMPEFQQIIYEAYSAYTLLIFNDGSELFGQLYDIFKIEVPLRRPFICHTECAYHRAHPDDPSDDLTYKHFLSYLRLLQTSGAYTWKDLQVQHFTCPYKPL
ncbi:kelch-like protein 26 [Drosophila montana]|uniref:kelch-like protein 26 n=1 Tax=Drosophila montana TaxID=40370 RepID=UPI00313B4528